MSADGRIERYADFGVAPGVRAPQTWQVDRAVFDDLLLRHASASGARVHERHRITDVAFDADGVTATVQRAGEPSPWEVRSRAVIDASGRGSVLSRKFNLRVDEPRLANVALFSHYSGVPRQAGRRAGDIRIVARPDLGWFWLIPISHELTSVGVVLPGRVVRDRSADAAQLLDETIGDTPVVTDLLRSARQEWPVRVEKDFSFGARAYAGDRWLVAGDAGSFLDPVFSTGVAIALESGLEAAQAVDKGLATGDLSQATFRRFARRQQQRFVSFRRFVLAFYTPEFRDLFFSEDPPRGMFRAVVSVFAGYWQPPALTRVRIWLFFGLVRAQRRLGFAPRFTALQNHPVDKARR
jgi:flavin-dependent dehydrogenase